MKKLKKKVSVVYYCFFVVYLQVSSVRFQCACCMVAFKGSPQSDCKLTVLGCQKHHNLEMFDKKFDW